MRKPLTAVAISKMSKPGRYAAGDGLYLQVSQPGTKAWVFRYQRDGKARHMGLGPVGLVSLADAREKARDARRQLLDGLDPLERRKIDRAEAHLRMASAVTFSECADRYITAHEPAWKNAKHRAQWRVTLQTYAYPELGELPIGTVDVGLVLKVLEPIWATKPETAGRLRGRIEAVIDWATARDYRRGENPARWRGHLDKLLPSRRKVREIKHHAALPYFELPAFMEALRSREGTGARALEFAILTAARTGEVIGANWSEINFDTATWTVPATRMKSGREHRVPLSGRAIELLTALPRETGGHDGFVFIGGRASKRLTNTALFATLHRMGRGDVTAHGFRSSFRDWAAETTGYPPDVVEMALAHVVSSKVEAAYRRGDLFEKRRRLMVDWAHFSEGATRKDVVVSIHRNA